MIKKVYYEKVGRRYKPVAEYDSEYLDSFPQGSHLVVVKPGISSRRFRIDPALAPMIAAGTYAEEEIARAINMAAELRPQRSPVTVGQQRAWKKLAREFGDDLCTLSRGSARDLAEAGVNAMVLESYKLLQNPAVKEAYDHFMFIAKLAYDENQNKV
jgi:hypothetical protein